MLCQLISKSSVYGFAFATNDCRSCTKSHNFLSYIDHFEVFKWVILVHDTDAIDWQTCSPYETIFSFPYVTINENKCCHIVFFFMPWIGVYHGEMDVIQWTWYFFHITSGRINKCKGVNQLKELFFLNLIIIFLNICLKLTNHRDFMIKNPLFFTIHNKNVVLL